MGKEKVSINYGIAMNDYMKGVMKTLVQQDDYKGIGGHGLSNHRKHGLHKQTSIGIGKKTVNFRRLK